MRRPDFAQIIRANNGKITRFTVLYTVYCVYDIYYIHNIVVRSDIFICTKNNKCQAVSLTLKLLHYLGSF